MTRIFPEYKRSTFYALIGALFHLVVLVLPVIITAGKVKLIYYMFIWFDFPLFLLGSFIPDSLRFIFHWMSETAWLCILGTIMYALGVGSSDGLEIGICK